MITPRAGKYCPRCQTMTFVDSDVCDNCGHRFRTGVAEPTIAPTAEPDPLHKTMQFTLPPLPPRRPEPTAVTFPLPEAQPERRWAGIVLFLAGTVLAAGLVFFWYRHTLMRPTADAASPAGTWESAWTGHQGAMARLTFVFSPDGTGTFSWAETNAGMVAPQTGQSPLHWQQDPSGALALTIAPSSSDTAADGVIRTLNRRHWFWHRDQENRRLILGRLVLQEKRLDTSQSSLRQ